MDEKNGSVGQEAVLPEEMEAVIEERMRAANERLIAAEIREIGAQMGLVDAQAAFTLMDKSGISVDDGGSVAGVREALEALVAAKPYLAGQRRVRLGTGRVGNFPRNDSDGADYAARLAAARNAGNNALATAIISEAAKNGIYLR